MCSILYMGEYGTIWEYSMRRSGRSRWRMWSLLLPLQYITRVADPLHLRRLHIQISLFTKMRTRCRFGSSYSSKWCESKTNGLQSPPGLRFEPPSLHCERPWPFADPFWASKASVLNFYFNAIRIQLPKNKYSCLSYIHLFHLYLLLCSPFSFLLFQFFLLPPISLFFLFT